MCRLDTAVVEVNAEDAATAEAEVEADVLADVG